ncbi:hypothetical protein PtrV1_06184 [Pyrenophora tritici-repentis]|uniref:Herpes-BLLF1 multi-domain protein n=1 Tax=Pyrenophora tritici-repentis TaxID=45151 RepID=A0A317A9K4_9PLEO|nr:hypothetical protein PtrV1_06184 [Pyrenophora tritici-repentis]KAF7450909.1 hypothetical protein A1F99_055250 [Pyrenophora tritici-repentis]KAF7573577.1 Herpes-BLLF1 multi-domain protein [Pyrenophora tritici-repentis]KAI0583657.1 hypothetical protein Alg215_03504 [Pyrenophora tritici-repentis]
MSAIESFVRRKNDRQAYSRKAELARAEKITYKQALQSLYDRRHALSTAHPFSVRSLGHGNTFAYRQGTICVLHGEVVRVSDLRSQSSSILDLVSIIRQRYPIFPGECKIRLLNYSEGVLAIYCTKIRGSETSYIYAINTAPDCPTDKRVIERIPLAACDRLLVRHNSRYLYYVTHTGRGDDGERKWEIEGISLDINFPLPRRERPLLLENFHGSDIGSTIAFEIHNNHFYAVSNQESSEVEEIDYTSFYHVVRFPLNSPLPDEVEKDERLYRRQHKEGPIHDTWTDLTLQIDECTNDTVIVESRREWVQASSRQSRTFYVTKLNFGEDFEDMLDEQLLPENEPLVPLIDSSNHPHWKPTPALYSWNQHPEFSSTDTTRRSFMLARTKFRAYNYACTSFLDLVEDDRCCNSPSQPPCLRLRVGSRREMGLQYTYSNSGNNAESKAPIHPQQPGFIDNATRYRHSPIRMWPPPASHCPCSKHLHTIMNPALPSGNTPLAKSVTGVLDGNYFIYMVKPGRTYNSGDDSALGSIVVVDFSRGFPVANTNSSDRRNIFNSQRRRSMPPLKDDSDSDSLYDFDDGSYRPCMFGTDRPHTMSGSRGAAMCPPVADRWSRHHDLPNAFPRGQAGFQFHRGGLGDSSGVGRGVDMNDLVIGGPRRRYGQRYTAGDFEDVLNEVNRGIELFRMLYRGQMPADGQMGFAEEDFGEDMGIGRRQPLQRQGQYRQENPVGLSGPLVEGFGGGIGGAGGRYGVRGAGLFDDLGDGLGGGFGRGGRGGRC